MKLKWVPLPEPIGLPPADILVTRTADESNAFPCRRCLKDGQSGETLHLISYNPFPANAKNSPYQGPGPVFVHTKDCAKYTGYELPEQQRRRLLSVRAYARGHIMVDAAVLQGDELVEKAGRMFEDGKVGYLHVHYAGPGCFALRVEKG